MEFPVSNTTDILDYEKVYTVRISEQEMQTIGNALARYFNICAGLKSPVPPQHAAVLGPMLQRFKQITMETKPVLMRKENLALKE